MCVCENDRIKFCIGRMLKTARATFIFQNLDIIQHFKGSFWPFKPKWLARERFRMLRCNQVPRYRGCLGVVTFFMIPINVHKRTNHFLTFNYMIIFHNSYSNIWSYFLPINSMKMNTLNYFAYFFISVYYLKNVVANNSQV